MSNGFWFGLFREKLHPFISILIEIVKNRNKSLETDTLFSSPTTRSLKPFFVILKSRLDLAEFETLEHKNNSKKYLKSRLFEPKQYEIKLPYPSPSSLSQVSSKENPLFLF